MSLSSPQVLIVGAGPTGLGLALRLKAHGIAFRIIDKNSGPGLASRAIALHARTLEYYDQLGFADEMVGKGLKLETIHMRENGCEIAKLNLGDMGQGTSPYPFMLNFPQDDHERFLVDKLNSAGVKIEWDTELKSFVHDDQRVSAVLQSEKQEESLVIQYMCGCDGAHSKVREGVNASFPGGTYNHLFWVADVKLGGKDNTDGFMCVNSEGFVLMMPVRSSGMQRFIGIIQERAEGEPRVTFEDVRPFAEKQLGVKVQEINWFSVYHAHHRVADHFRFGRCFILGDAGHIHSPVGGQGMNTGIGDSVNLSWKLAHVLRGQADPSLLDTYEVERIAFARVLVSTTDRAFQQIVSDRLGGRFLRGWLMPRLLPFLTKFRSMRSLMFKTVSQVRIHYQMSDISEGKAGEIAGGDRLPWVLDGDKSNYRFLRSLQWQVHVYGEMENEISKTCDRLLLTSHQLPWNSQVQEKGLSKNAAYLIRPDGYIAMVATDHASDRLIAYAARLKIQFGQS